MDKNVNIFALDLREIVTKECPVIAGTSVAFFDDITAGEVKMAQEFKDSKDLDAPLRMLVAQIADWNFADESQTKLPITVESLNRLPFKVLTWLFEAQAEILSAITDKKKESLNS